MKNLFKVFWIIALAAIIVFSMTTCGPGGGNADVRIRSFNNNGTMPEGGRSARAAVGAYSTDTESFADLNTFYESLGNLKSSITPISFKMASSVYFWDANGNNIHTGKALYDFVNETTITVDNVPAGVTCVAVEFNIGAGVIGPTSATSGWATVDFAYPGGKDGFESWNKKGHTVGMSGLPTFNNSCNDSGEATINMMLLKPDTNGSDIQILSIVYDSRVSQRKLQAIYYDPVYYVPDPDLNLNSIAIPFNAVTVPSSGPITFNISWNLNGIISHYEGKTNDVSDDIFVLKKDFWDELYMSISY